MDVTQVPGDPGYETPPPAKPREQGSPGDAETQVGPDVERLRTPTSEQRAAYSSGTESPAEPVNLERRLDTKSLDEAKEEILDKFFDAEGNYKYIYFIEDSESESDEEEEDGVQTGGAAPSTAEKDQSLADATAAYTRARSKYNDEAVLKGTTVGVDVAERIQQVISRSSDGFPATWGLNRTQWEDPKAGQQCADAGNAGRDRPCWLCGNPVNMGQGGILHLGKRMSVCSPFENQYECEHVLPGVLMLFLKKMVNDTLGDAGKLAARRANLYDSSCHVCNTTKSDGLYIKAYWQKPAAGQRLVFSPHNEKIMLDILTFVIATRSGQTVELRRVPAIPPPGEGGVTYRERMIHETKAESEQTEPICSNRKAVVAYTAKIERGAGQLVVSRSVFTSVTAVAEPADPSVVDAIATSLPASYGDNREAAARAAETAAAFNIAPRYNNLTRAVIEQEVVPAVAALVAAPDGTKLDMSQFTYEAENLINEHRLFSRMFKVPTAAELASGRAAPIGVDQPGNQGPDDVEIINQEFIAELRAAGVPTRVNRDKAWSWIRGRYIAIWSRMNTLCTLLNEERETIEASVIHLADHPLFTVADIDALGAWNEIKLPQERLGKKRKLEEGGGLRFTIRRRSETRQTKKNRRRRVIEVSV